MAEGSVDGMLPKNEGTAVPVKTATPVSTTEEVTSEPEASEVPAEPAVEEAPVEATEPVAPVPAANSDKSGSGKGMWIVLTILALVLGLVGGYVYGKNSATTASQEELQKQVTALESDLAQAKQAVSGKLDEGEASIETLQTENAQLQATIDELNAQIADLEEQLEEAESSDTTPSDTTTTE